MGSGAVITDYGRKADLNRYLNSSSSYLPPTVIRIGIGTTSPLTSDTAIEIPVPISDGTVNDDGSNTFTGSNGADNSTDNTTTYKEGASVTDATAQNLIANDTDATKTWTISDLSSAGTIVDEEQPISLWFYIADQTTLDKFKTSGTCLEIKVGSDSSNYYSITKEADDLETGWNWITTNTDNVEDLDETGTVSGDIDTFIIEITTNNATDEFEAGDVVVDLLRQWEESDLSQVYSTGYPSYNDVDFTATIKSRLGATAGTGFNISELGLFDTDGNMHVHIVFDAESKDSTDEFEMQPVIDTEV